MADEEHDAGPVAGGRPVADMSFGAASAELDRIVDLFERGEIDVDRLVALLERATAIVDELDRRIRSTRAQVEELVPRLAAAAADARGPGDAVQGDVAAAPGPDAVADPT